MTRIHSLIFRGVCAVFLTAFQTPVALRAQDAPASAVGTTAHVRFWKTELRDFASLRVTYKSAGGRRPAPREIGIGKPGYVFNNYNDAPVGHGALEVFSGTEARPVTSLPIDFAPGEFVTILLCEPEKAGNPPRLEVIDDGNIATATTHSQITVRNFVADLKDVHLTVGDILNVQFVSGDSFLQMRGLKSALYPLRTVGTGLDGKPFDWNIDVDFRQIRHQTLLIYPDPYGRVRPRLVPDGNNQAESPQAADKDGQR